MASKRRKAAAGSDRCDVRSPAWRSSRRRGAPEATESPCGRSQAKRGTAGDPPVSPLLPPETCLYKTPKRKLASRSRLPTFSSPANENDTQQEIFWDPYSPITHKRDNERKKHTVNDNSVEISEIVNRIAPQDEKTACCEGNLFGIWIGDDAIPCTPGITNVRSRTKVNGVRSFQLKNREEELMELAKQFDKNLTDAIQDQDTSCHVASEAEMSVEHENEAQGENQEQLLQDLLETNTSCGVVGESSGRLKLSENRNQEPIDLEAEVALNELFDGPTQVCSGHLSQGLSDCSSSSSFLESQGNVLQEEHASTKVTSVAGNTTWNASQEQGSVANFTESMELLPAQKTQAVSKQAASHVASSKTELSVSAKLEQIVGDDVDDWGNDSFLMQITQNPELIRTPQHSFPNVSEDSDKIRRRTRDSEKLSIVQGRLFKPFENDSTSDTLQKQSTGSDKVNDVQLETKNKSLSKSGQNKLSTYNPVSVHSKSKGIQQGYTQLKCPTSNSSEKRAQVPTVVHPQLPKTQLGKYGNNTGSISCHLPAVSSRSTALPDPQDATDPSSSGCSKFIEAPKRNMFTFQDLNEPKFSDEILGSYCESDSLWGANCDDDDDLLYQVCDEVEKNTQSQVVEEKKEKPQLMVESNTRLEVGSSRTGLSHGLSNCPQPQNVHLGRKTFSLGPPAAVATRLKNENSALPPARQQSVSEGVRRAPEKWSRSHSVPEGDLSLKTGSPVLSNGYLNVCDVKWQNGLGNVSPAQGNPLNQVPAVKSNYVLRKTDQSQTLALDLKNIRLGRHPGLSESKNAANILRQTTNIKPHFQRHLSDSFIQSGAEQKNRKCSQEEIAKKKQEALERRKWKMETLLKNIAPT